MYKAPLRDAVDLNSQKCRTLKSGGAAPLSVIPISSEYCIIPLCVRTKFDGFAVF